MFLKFKDFCFLSRLIRNFLVKAAFSSYYLNLSLPTFLKRFLIFAKFQPHVSYIHAFTYMSLIIKSRGTGETKCLFSIECCNDDCVVDNSVLHSDCRKT